MAPRVLIVDDHADFRRLARVLLERCGFEIVAEAGDASGALAAAREHAPDLVLLDVQLPDGDGIAVAAVLAGELPRTDVVLVSARTAADIGPRLRGAAVRGFIPKHRLSPASLAEVLRPAA